MKEALKSAFGYGKENGVVIPESWVMNNVLAIHGSGLSGNIMTPGVRENLQLLVSLDLQVLILKI
jgi:hypothetical protein